MKPLITNAQYFKNSLFVYVITYTDIVAMSAWPSGCKKWKQAIDYQGCQPVNEKLSDPPNKIIVF